MNTFKKSFLVLSFILCSSFTFKAFSADLGEPFRAKFELIAETLGLKADGPPKNARPRDLAQVALSTCNASSQLFRMQPVPQTKRGSGIEIECSVSKDQVRVTLRKPSGSSTEALNYSPIWGHTDLGAEPSFHFDKKTAQLDKYYLNKTLPETQRPVLILPGQCERLVAHLPDAPAKSIRKDDILDAMMGTRFDPDLSRVEFVSSPRNKNNALAMVKRSIVEFCFFYHPSRKLTTYRNHINSLPVESLLLEHEPAGVTR